MNILGTNFKEQMRGEEAAVNPLTTNCSWRGLQVQQQKVEAEVGIESYCQHLAGLDPGAVSTHCWLFTTL